MYSNYIFDLYGTLVDINTDESSKEFWYKLSLFYSFKGALYTAEELQTSYNNMIKTKLQSYTNTKYPDTPLEPIFSELYKLKGINPSKDLVIDTAHLFRTLSIKYIKLYDGVIELLELLKSKGKNIYLLSNSQRVFTFSEMKMLGIEKYFDDILFSADYEICKPDINFYNTLIKKHNLDIKDSIMIGNDYICDIAGATNAGLNSLYLHSNLSPEIKGPLTSTYSIMNMDISKISEFIIDSTKK